MWASKTRDDANKTLSLCIKGFTAPGFGPNSLISSLVYNFNITSLSINLGWMPADLNLREDAFPEDCHSTDSAASDNGNRGTAFGKATRYRAMSLKSSLKL